MADGLRLRIQDDAVQSYVDTLFERLGDLTPLMEDIGASIERNVELRFDTKRDPAGQPWVPLSPRTRAQYDRADRRPARGGGVEIARRGTLLERTGLMRDSLTYAATSDQVEIGFGRPYAAFHELGTSRMPRRGLLTADPTTGELGEDDRRSVLDLLQSYLGG